MLRVPGAPEHHTNVRAEWESLQKGRTHLVPLLQQFRAPRVLTQGLPLGKDSLADADKNGFAHKEARGAAQCVGQEDP